MRGVVPRPRRKRSERPTVASSVLFDTLSAVVVGSGVFLVIVLNPFSLVSGRIRGISSENESH
jgi:hypothetical protein